MLCVGSTYTLVHAALCFIFFVVIEAYHAATRSMARLNRTAALLMQKYGEYVCVFSAMHVLHDCSTHS